MQKNKYWKTLLGQFAEALISKSVEYSDSADYEAFVADAVEGELGLFNADTFALISGAAAVATGTKVFFALKRDGQVETTSSFVVADAKKSRAAYAAAVAQVSTATFTGAPVAGEYYSVKVIETTPGYQPFPSWEYDVVAAAGETITTLAAKIAAKINDRTNVANKGTDPIVTATSAAGVITITGSIGASFRLAFSRAALDDLGATPAYTTKPSLGNGTYDQIKQLEELTDVLKGVTTNYPGFGEANPEDFGKPTSMVVAGTTYNVYLFTVEATEKSPTPVEKHFHSKQIFIVIPSSGTSAEAEVKTIFGL